MTTTKFPLVVFEGIDGSGKTTLRNLIWNKLLQESVPTIAMGQHSWLSVSDSLFIAKLWSHNQNIHDFPNKSNSVREAYLRDKILHWEKNVLTALSHAVVLLDRSFISDIVYLNALYNIPIETTFNGIELHDLKRPDLLVYLEIDPAEAERRIVKRGRETRHYEHEAPLRLVQSSYSSLFNLYGETGQLFSQEFLFSNASLLSEKNNACEQIMTSIRKLVN